MVHQVSLLMMDRLFGEFLFVSVRSNDLSCSKTAGKIGGYRRGFYNHLEILLPFGLRTSGDFLLVLTFVRGLLRCDFFFLKANPSFGLQKVPQISKPKPPATGNSSKIFSGDSLLQKRLPSVTNLEKGRLAALVPKEVRSCGKAAQCHQAIKPSAVWP